MNQYPNPYSQQPGAGGYPQAPYTAPQASYGQPTYGQSPYAQPAYTSLYAPQPPYTPPQKQPETPEEKKRRKKKNRILIIIAVVCLLLAAAVVVGAIWKDRYDEKKLREEAANAPSFTITELPENLDDGLSTAEIAGKVTPSVVCINVYEYQSLVVFGSGSGIIMNDDGYIVTNAHVVEDASSVMVVLNDGTELEARIVGSDKRTDLAVVKISSTDLVPAEFGDSSQLQVGERAVAIGNAAGEFAGSVTQGVISGLNRQVPMSGETTLSSMNLIQTDAAINPGNSGGALVNRYGQVIGINSSKIASVDYEGLGFAIPINDVQPVVENLIAYGYVKDRAVLGVSVIELTPVTGPANNLPSQGLYISAIEDYSDLPNHDVTVGDVIIKADGQTLEDTATLSAILKSHKAGDTLTLEIQKGGSGTIVTVDVLLVAAPTDAG